MLLVGNTQASAYASIPTRQRWMAWPISRRWTLTAILKVDADVSTYGAAGIAYWALTPAQTDIDVGTYYIDIAWYDGSNEYIVYDGTVKVLERVSDL
jgi:hypothetical protein